MEPKKIHPKFNDFQNPKIGLIALASDYMIEKDFFNVIKDKNIDFFVNRIECYNPLTSENLIKMSEQVTQVAKDILPGEKIDCIVSSLNNGSHFLGLKSNFKNIDFVGVFSKSEFAKSINSYSNVEINKRGHKNDFKLIEANDRDIIDGSKLLIKEHIFTEGSACAVIGILKKIKKYKNVCCIISGSAHLNLPEIQKIILKGKINLS